MVTTASRRERARLAAGAEERVPVEADVVDRGDRRRTPAMSPTAGRQRSPIAELDEVVGEQREPEAERRAPHQRQPVGLHERLEQQVGAVLDRADRRVERLRDDLVGAVGVLRDRRGSAIAPDAREPELRLAGEAASLADDDARQPAERRAARRTPRRRAASARSSASRSGYGDARTRHERARPRADDAPDARAPSSPRRRRPARPRRRSRGPGRRPAACAGGRSPSPVEDPQRRLQRAAPGMTQTSTSPGAIRSAWP